MKQWHKSQAMSFVADTKYFVTDAHPAVSQYRTNDDFSMSSDHNTPVYFYSLLFLDFKIMFSYD